MNPPAVEAAEIRRKLGIMGAGAANLLHVGRGPRATDALEREGGTGAFSCCGACGLVGSPPPGTVTLGRPELANRAGIWVRPPGLSAAHTWLTHVICPPASAKLRRFDNSLVLTDCAQPEPKPSINPSRHPAPSHFSTLTAPSPVVAPQTTPILDCTAVLARGKGGGGLCDPAVQRFWACFRELPK